MPLIGFPLPCRGCGSSLEGIDSTGVCAACRCPCAATLKQVGVAPEDLRVAADVLCLGCGYNLRTLPSAGLCPECGRPVAGSLRADDLRGASPSWMRKVRAGATLQLVMTIGAVLMFVLLGIAAALQNTPVFTPSILFTVVSGVLGLACMIAYAVSIFWITVSDPSLQPPEAPWPRMLARVGAVVPLPLWGLSMYHAQTQAMGPGSVPTNVALLPTLIGSLSMLLFVLAEAGVVVCLRRIFIRTYRFGMRTVSTVLIWLLVVGSLTMSSGSIAQMYAMKPVMVWAATAGTATAPAGGSGGVYVAPGVTVTDYSRNPGRATTSPTVTATAPATAPAATMPAFPTFGPLFWVAMAANCGGVLLMIGSYVLGIIVLVSVRRILKQRLPRDVA